MELDCATLLELGFLGRFFNRFDLGRTGNFAQRRSLVFAYRTLRDTHREYDRCLFAEFHITSRRQFTGSRLGKKTKGQSKCSKTRSHSISSG